MSSTDFDINEVLKFYLSDPASVATPEAESALQDCENDPDSLTPAVVNTVLNPIIEAIASNPEAIARPSVFDSLQFLLKCEPVSLCAAERYKNTPDCELFKLSRYSSFLQANAVSKILDVVTSGLVSEAESMHNDPDSEEQDVVRQHKVLLEMYAFLLQWSISVVETKAAEKSSSAAPAKGRGAGKGAKAKTSPKEGSWDSLKQLQSALEAMCKVLRMKLGKAFMTTSERDTFVGLFTRPVYLIFESEQRVKSTAIRMHAYKVLCIAVKHHGHGFGELRTNKSGPLSDRSHRSSNIYHSEPHILRASLGANG